MNEFTRSLRSLDADDPRRWSLAMLGVALVLGAWAAWFLFARVTLLEVTRDARLEVDRAAHPIQAPVEGRVTVADLELGREVEAGQLLVELDTRSFQLELAEERTRLAALPPQIEALREEIAAKRRSLGESEQAARAALEQAREDQREAESLAGPAEGEAVRAEQLFANGLISQADVHRAKGEALSRRAAARSRQMAVERLELDERVRSGDRRAELERLAREQDSLLGELETRRSAAQRIAYEIERRRIRAPVRGRLGEVVSLRLGQFLNEGDKVAAVVPAGTLRVVAQFAPADALGRIRPGQTARLRLEGFPWAQYGTVAMTVTRIASEVRDGRIRVELAVRPNGASRVPLQHGLPGTVEVEVERVAPAALVLRAAGKALASPSASAASAGRP